MRKYLLYFKYKIKWIVSVIMAEKHFYDNNNDFHYYINKWEYYFIEAAKIKKEIKLRKLKRRGN